MTAVAMLGDFIGDPSSRWLIVGSTAGAVAAIVASASVLVGRRQAQVERRLAGYDVGDAMSSDAPSAGLAPPDWQVVQTGVDIASRLAARAGALARIEQLLEQADLPMRAGELVFYVPLFAIFAFLFFAILGGPLLGVIFGAAVLLMPYAYVEARRSRRLRAFEEVLPSTLTLMASSLRAGFSLMQALETVSQEAGEPMRRELARVFTEVRLGRPIDDALGEVADRMNSRDLGWTVMAIRIQREVGGNLASLLDTVADTMTKRQQLRREVRTLTAEGRLSAVVLSLFPPGLAIVLWLVQPHYINKLFDEALGIAAVGAAVVFNIVGWFILRNIVNIED
jgi:tight adherence protein B